MLSHSLPKQTDDVIAVEFDAFDQARDHLQPEHHRCIYGVGADHGRDLWPGEPEYTC